MDTGYCREEKGDWLSRLPLKKGPPSPLPHLVYGGGVPTSQHVEADVL